ncbi:MAG TPA: VWA domain-containing protein [Oscillospiraceae bacterium]|nr:VWA domain-containing protein [Oscillospiraceae bacterium]
MTNRLEVNVVRFVQLLRHMGLRIGSSEVIDALQALQEVELSERDAVRLALQATLVKRPGEQAVFTQAFARFFASPEVRAELEQEYAAKLAQRQEMLAEASEDLQFRDVPLALSEEEKLVYAAIPPAARQKMLDYIQRTAEGKQVEADFRPVLESMVRGSLTFWRKSLRNELGQLALPQSDDPELNALLASMEEQPQAAADSLLAEDMQNIAEQDLPRAQLLLQKLARQLVTRIERRFRQGKRRQQLDVRKTIRHNMRFGGTMFKLRYRNHRRQKPQLLLLCDVSGSMARYASFVLQFIYSIHSVVSSIEGFVFAEDVERVTDYFQASTDFTQTMVELMNRSQEWGRGTELATALQSLRANYPHLLSSQTYLLIVSDTKTMKVTQAVQELAEIKRMVKDVVWLNTLPAPEWEKASSVEAFQQVVRMYPCNTLLALEQVMRQKIIA